ncbi:MAG: iron ABC transporter permease [Phycisphaerae bacterium]|jgi:iron(III) transport system permease protein
MTSPKPPRDNPLLQLSRATQANPMALLGEVIILAFLLVFLVLPVGLAISQGFFEKGHLTLYWFRAKLSDPVMIRQMVNSVALATCSTLLAMVIAIPPALIRARCHFRGLGVLAMLLLVPMILPPFVGAISMRHLLSQFGAINLALEHIGLLDFSRSLPPDWLGSGFAGVVIMQALHLFPILYLNASAALANIDPAYSQAARNLGAGPWRTFVAITLPLMRPGLFAGGTIVFIWALTDVGTPLILGFQEVIPATIFKELAKSDTSPGIYSLVFIMLGASVSLYILGKFFFGRAISAETAKASSAADVRKLGWTGTALAWLLFGTIIFLAMLPHVGVILTAFSGRWVNTVLPTRWTLEHLRFVLERPATFQSILNSLHYASLSTIIDIVLGCLAAWLIVRTRVWGHTLLDGLAMLPLAVPGLILAAGYVAMTASDFSFHLGSWQVTIPLSEIGPRNHAVVILVIAYSVRRLPFVLRGVSAGLQQVPTSLEEVARNLGAGRVRTVFGITVPLVAANIVAAAVLTFAFAVLEVSDSLILAQREAAYPITKEIYSQATSGNPDAANIASALGVYGMVLLGGTMALASALLGKRLGAIFRA